MEDLLLKFENGHSRYGESSLFFRCINSLDAGVCPYELIDKLILMNESMQKELERIILTK